MQHISEDTILRDESTQLTDKKPEIPEELVFTAQQKITLNCGKSRITLYPNGKVVIKGEYILSDAEGVNRLSGGRIEVN
ncbi:hypothetical protein LDR49_004048 [Salmonella enterica]|uniref:DUF2345 domain-containing protein n=2 Tax=Salmonella enterica TaxID=28901 RepID=A0A5U7LWU9_SALER|nr:hypothetical protein [Salmonella enterica]EBP3305467.1 DUF2345 domain-containing protein [Salmonella enterica subsp. enterica]ECA4081325.1 hypothetical protein [Salmonella enterica subsp. enterica serovar Texas]EDX2436606.1 DUF2345 domain-containing protein [Salmonella enterica subsp. enterica serovar Koenigstuhl]VEA03364.1 Uncharacterised protein [Salmonella enterica subsp. enterica serovar Sanjuan]